MDEYISREEVINITAETGAWETQNRVRELPTADVQPVKHGRWIIDYAEGTKIYHAHCSECNKEPARNIGGDYYIDKLSDFCPNCGARIDGGSE